MCVLIVELLLLLVVMVVMMAVAVGGRQTVSWRSSLRYSKNLAMNTTDRRTHALDVSENEPMKAKKNSTSMISCPT